MNDLTGTIIKGYKLEKQIKGGMGDVYRAVHPTFGTDVAMKVIKSELANNPEFIRRFELEAQLIKRLEHLHIVPLHDFWRDADGAYLVMRWLRGGSLREQIESNSGLDIEDIVVIINQVAQGLHHAHKNQVVHRDIKPENILLDEDGNAYVADFGIAKDHISDANLTGADNIIGTPEYIAPEQAQGAATLKSDIYSLGVILYELLERQHPFKAANRIDMVFKHINDPLPNLQTPDPDILSALNDVVQKATAKDPAQRFKDIMEMAQALKEAAKLTPSQAGGFSLVELLTPREQEVMQLIIDGKKNREIADILVLEESTVKSYIKSIYRKLKVRSRVQAIERARDLNFVIKKPDMPIELRTGHLPEPENPYKGLQAFENGDAPNFFGRDNLITKLVDRMQEDVEYRRFLAIVGPSGSGKSSVAKAGLIPAIWRGELSDLDNPYIAEMLPRNHPIDNLEIALVKVATENPQIVREQLMRDSRGLIRVANMILPDDGSEILLVIDQFEEVFTHVENVDDCLHFLNLLREVVTDSDSRVRIVVTLRADYYDKPLQYPEFGDMLRNRVETVLPLSADELEQAVKYPANNVGVKFEDGLVSKIVSDVRYQPAALPLLQYALTELFERRDGRTLTRQAYTDIGGTGGALAKRADEIYLEGNGEGQALVKQLFLRLVTLGEGAEDTRRRVDRSELLEITDDPELMDEIIDIYAQSRLLSLDHDPSTRKPTVEVAHEAILREWERLREWLNNSRDDIKQERQIAQEAEAWQVNSRDTSYLRTGSKLEQAEHWQSVTELALIPLVSEFIQSSVKEAKAQELAEQERVEREKQQEKRSRTLLRALVAVFAVAAILSGGFGLIAMNERDNAQDAEYEARRQASIGLAAMAREEMDGAAPERAVLLALEALEYYPYTSQAERVLADAIEANISYIELEPNNMWFFADSAWSHNGNLMVVGIFANDFETYLLDTNTGVLQDQIMVDMDNDCRLGDVAWSPTDDRFVTTLWTIMPEPCPPTIWDAHTGESLLTLTSHGGLSMGSEVVDWSSDGTTILTAGPDGIARLSDTETGQELSIFANHTDVIRDADLSPSGDRAVTASADGTARIWDTETGEELLALSGHVGAVNSVTWSPNGNRIATASEDGIARIWDAFTGELLLIYPGHTDEVLGIAWSPQGDLIATISRDQTAQVWNATTGEIFSTQRSTGISAIWSPSGVRLFFPGQVANPRIWKIPDPPLRLVGHTGIHLTGAHWSPDGTLIATSSSDDGTIRIWDAVTGEELLLLEDVAPGYIGWSPDSTRIAGSMSSPRIWDAATGEVLLEFDLPPGAWYFLTRWVPDGTRLAASTYPLSDQPYMSRVVLLDATTGETLISTEARGCLLHAPSWNPELDRFATTCTRPDAELYPDGNSPAYIWNATTGEMEMMLESDHGQTYMVRWSPDGHRIATGHEDGSVIIWDASTGEEIFIFFGHSINVVPSWSPDGARIVSADNNGIVKVWNIETGEEAFGFTIPGAIQTIEWSPDGTHIMASGLFPEPVIRRAWPSTQALIDEAYECCVTRELTDEERQQFGLPVRDDG